MPITFDNAYNRKLAADLQDLEMKQSKKFGFNPEVFSDKMPNYHGAKIGGGSNPNKKYISNGNSIAFPPPYGYTPNTVSTAPRLHGGYSFNDFLGDAADGVEKVGRIATAAAPFLPLMGLGHKKPRKKGGKIADTVVLSNPLEGSGRKRLVKGSPEAKAWGEKMKAARLAKKGQSVSGSGHKKRKEGGFLREGVQRLFEVAKPAVKELGRRAINAISKKSKEFVRSKAGELAERGANYLKSKTNDPLAHMVIDTVARKGKHMATQQADKLANQGADFAKGKLQGMGGRSRRAEIVKKVMKEKGLKMIEASKYVKLHGLY